MNAYQCNQRRLLALIAAMNWGSVSSEDEQSIEMLIVTGYVHFAPSVRHHHRIRLKLTDEGWRFLYHLQGNRPFLEPRKEFRASSNDRF